MTTRVKRLPALILIGVMLVCVLYSSSVPARQTVAATVAATASSGGSAATPAATTAAAAPATSAASNTGPGGLPATRPTIHASLKGAEVQGIAGSYCWPDASPQCDFQDDPQPTTQVNVASGDAISFTVDPASPAPADMTGTLLDDKTADGDLKTVDLSGEGGTFTVDSTLTSGSHRLAVEAIYLGSIQGNKPFVTTVYLLTIGTGAAPATSSASTGAGTSVALATQAAQPATEVATEQTLAVSTATPLPPTEVPTTPAVAPTFVPATVAATVAAPVATATIPPTVAPSPTATSIPPTVAPTTAPTTASNGTSSQPPAVVTVVVTAETAGTELPPISTATVPPLQLIVGGKNYDFIAVNACAVGAGGSTLCVNQPANSSAPRILALPNDAAQIAFQGPRPTAIQVSVLTSDGVKEISHTSVPPDNLSLYTLPANPGSYVLAIEITYPSGKATYYYRLDITG